jgi:hypothetical protein
MSCLTDFVQESRNDKMYNSCILLYFIDQFEACVDQIMT